MFCFSLHSVTQRERNNWEKIWITFRLEFYNCCIFPVTHYFTVVTFHFAPKQKLVGGLCTKIPHEPYSFCHFQRKRGWVPPHLRYQPVLGKMLLSHTVVVKQRAWWDTTYKLLVIKTNVHIMCGWKTKILTHSDQIETGAIVRTVV